MSTWALGAGAQYSGGVCCESNTLWLLFVLLQDRFVFSVFLSRLRGIFRMGRRCFRQLRQTVRGGEGEVEGYRFFQKIAYCFEPYENS